jgi:acyl-CoA thioester hydrolase
MFLFEQKIRVRYAETDKMGYVYYGNYATYFEVARVEALRSLYVSYKKMEEDGIILPVYKYSNEFYKPAHYDDELIIKTFIREMPTTKIHFYFEIINSKNELINKAEVTLVFVSLKNNKPCKPPQFLISQLSSYLK